MERNPQDLFFFGELLSRQNEFVILPSYLLFSVDSFRIGHSTANNMSAEASSSTAPSKKSKKGSKAAEQNGADNVEEVVNKNKRHRKDKRELQSALRLAGG